MFRVEVERADGKTFFVGGGAPREWRYPEDACAHAEDLWLKLQHTEDYARFSVIEDDGSVYSDLEC